MTTGWMALIVAEFKKDHSANGFSYEYRVDQDCRHIVNLVDCRDQGVSS